MQKVLKVLAKKSLHLVVLSSPSANIGRCSNNFVEKHPSKGGGFLTARSSSKSSTTTSIIVKENLTLSNPASAIYFDGKEQSL